MLYDPIDRKRSEQVNSGKEQIHGCQGLGEGEKGPMSRGCRVSFRGNENILKLIVEVVAQLCECTRNHRIAHSDGLVVW